MGPGAKPLVPRATIGSIYNSKFTALSPSNRKAVEEFCQPCELPAEASPVHIRLDSRLLRSIETVDIVHEHINLPLDSSNTPLNPHVLLTV